MNLHLKTLDVFIEFLESLHNPKITVILVWFNSESPWERGSYVKHSGMTIFEKLNAFFVELH